MQEEKYHFVGDKLGLKSCLLTADTGYPALPSCVPHTVTFEHMLCLTRKSHREVEVEGGAFARRVFISLQDDEPRS